MTRLLAFVDIFVESPEVDQVVTGSAERTLHELEQHPPATDEVQGHHDRAARPRWRSMASVHSKKSEKTMRKRESLS